MIDSEEEDIFSEGGYDSDKDEEWLPSETKKKRRFCGIKKYLEENNHTPIEPNVKISYNNINTPESNCMVATTTNSIVQLLHVPEASTSTTNIIVQLESEIREGEQLHVPESSTSTTNANIQLESENKEDAQLYVPERKKCRKRLLNPQGWKQNIRKEKRQRGEEYVSKNKIIPAKCVKKLKDCSKCIYKCCKVITLEEQEQIFKDFYSLDKRAKITFITSSCEICVPDRRRKGKDNENSRKKQTYKYFFKIKERKVQVCKKYFLGTLAVSQKTIYRAMQNRNSTTNIPFPIRHGKHIKKRIPDDVVKEVKMHIASFPRVQSHYCRSDSKCEYVEGSLTVTKMYELYQESMKTARLPSVKLSQYRYIFSNNFNIRFNKPKKDRCSVCELNHIQTAENPEKGTSEEYLKHIQEKQASRISRKRDRDSGAVVLTFDLENVLTCPKAEVSQFFYKSKLAVYNLAAHLSIFGQVYCCVWPEVLTGRKGNDIASAVVKILGNVVAQHPDLNEIILWSDSCVPQNRNSNISYALANFLRKQNTLKKIVLKYSTPGHSCVQEIDSVHSVIERVLSKVEYYSPVSLMRILTKINSKKPYKIIQMKKTDFFDYKSLADTLYNYNEVPYKKVTSLEIIKDELTIGFKTSHESKDFTVTNLKRSTRKSHETSHEVFPDPKLFQVKPEIPLSKRDAILSMLPYMPQQDREYYQTVLPVQNKTKKGEKSTKNK